MNKLGLLFEHADRSALNRSHESEVGLECEVKTGQELERAPLFGDPICA